MPLSRKDDPNATGISAVPSPVPSSEVAEKLIAALESGTVVLVPLPVEQVECRALAARTLGLASILEVALGPLTGRCRLTPYSVDPGYSWVDLGERQPLEKLLVSAEGNVIKYTCTSYGPDGGAAGESYMNLSASAAREALVRLNGELERRALAAEERRLEDAARRRRAEAAKKLLAAKLRKKGIT